jgi:two-component system, LytTR family, response regulator
MAIRTLIVDDEALARRKILSFLAPHADFQVAGECVGGDEAVDAIVRLRPELVLLDVRIPQMDGFRVLENLRPRNVPEVVFVTAHQEYAVKAFEVHALDYLLKPFNRRRFEDMLQRVRERRMQNNGDPKGRFLQWLRERTKEHSDRLVIKSNGRIVLLPSAKIEWIEGQGDYVRVHLAKDSYLTRDTLQQMHARLNPQKFFRIHRSVIVNLDFIAEFHPLWAGDYKVLLRDGTELTLSRAYRQRLQSARQELKL